MSRLIKRYNYLSRGVNGRSIAVIHSKIKSPARIGSRVPFLISLISNVRFVSLVSFATKQAETIVETTKINSLH